MVFVMKRKCPYQPGETESQLAGFTGQGLHQWIVMHAQEMGVSKGKG